MCGCMCVCVYVCVCLCVCVFVCLCLCARVCTCAAVLRVWLLCMCACVGVLGRDFPDCISLYELCWLRACVFVGSVPPKSVRKKLKSSKSQTRNTETVDGGESGDVFNVTGNF